MKSFIRFAPLFAVTFLLLPFTQARADILLDDFEGNSQEWKFVGGEEFPGAKGSLGLAKNEAHTGQGSYRLEADFSRGGKYVGMWRDLTKTNAGGIRALRCWVKARGATKFSVRINDATGQCHQQSGLPLKNDGEWQELVFKIEDLVGGEHWGGANDGRWHGAPEGFGINLIDNGVDAAHSGTIWIDDLRAEFAPEAKPTLQACVLAQPVCRPAFGTAVTFRWGAVPMSRDYKVFVHVRGPDGRTAFQADHDLPVATSSWSGQVTYDETLVIPPDLPPGEYQIVAGLWNPKGGVRLPLLPGAGVAEIEPNGYQIGVLNVALDAPLPELPKPSLKLDGYRVTFDEDFTGKLDVSAWGPGTRWIAHTPFAADFGDAKFTDPGADFPFTVENGILRIEARKVDGHWQSGLLASVDRQGNGFAQKFGYFEMRAKLPKGPGVWPAFWLMGQRGVVDKSIINIEIDVLEQYGARPNALASTVHYWGPNNYHRAEGRTFIIPGMTDDFHRYGVLIEEDFTTFYFDGIELFRRKTPPEAKVPVYPLVNLALGSGWPIEQTPNPSILEVDYVRVWSR